MRPAAGIGSVARPGEPRRTARPVRWGERARVAGTLAARTLRDSRDDRILGVAAEVAFFALLAIPPTLLILAGSAGYVGDLLGPSVSDALKDWVVRSLGEFLAPDTMVEFVEPTVDRVFAKGQGGILSIGVVLAVWSSSRLVKTLVEAMNIAYDVQEWRPGWKRRLLAVAMTFGGLLALSIFLPLVVAGPRLGQAIERQFDLGGAMGVVWAVVYWPATIAIGISMLTTLYHVAPNWHTPWHRDVPGAVLAAITWIAAAFVLRSYVGFAISESALGALAAPIALLLWLYASSLVVILGGEINAEIEKMWPTANARPKDLPASSTPRPHG
jgi:membrane protein